MVVVSLVPLQQHVDGFIEQCDTLAYTKCFPFLF